MVTLDNTLDQVHSIFRLAVIWIRKIAHVRIKHILIASNKRIYYIQ